MTKPVHTTRFLWIGMVATLWICAGSAHAADPAPTPPKDSSGQQEQSPEEAAGGKQNLQRMRKACDEDVKKLCPDIRPGGGRIMQCLHGQESNLTPACRQALGPRSSNP